MGRGSTWNIWDFHLHTPCSVLNNQFGDPDKDETWDRYIEAIETRAAAKGIAAIGITDYFTIEGYKRVLKYKQNGRLQNLFIFPNIEFRVDTIIQRRRLNYHVIFSPEVPLSHIEEHFLHDINFVHEQQPFQSPYKRKLRVSNLKEFGEELRRQHEPFRSRTALEIGFMNAKVQLEQIKQRLSEDGRFSGKHLLILADEDLSLMNWDGQDHATRKQLLQMSHGIFSSNSSTRDFCLGKYHDSEEKFVDEFKSLKPCIWGCDSHSLTERFLEPDENRYCWIKGEISWEGLKQVLYEPEERVRIQPDNPEPSKSYFTMESAKITCTQINNDLCVDDLEVELNPNLIAIIGGRGSGKTALLDLIAACFSEGKKLEELENSFYHRVYETERRHDPNARPIPVSLRFQSGEVFPKRVGEEDSIFERSNVLYLTQNHMDEYTANPANLYGHIVELVFEQEPDRRQDYDRLHEQAEELQHEIESLNLAIEQLREQVEGKLDEEQKKRTQKRGDLNDYQNRLEEQESQQADSGQETAELTNRLRTLREERDHMIVLHERLDVLSGNIEQFHSQYQIDAETINNLQAKLSELPTLSPVPSKIAELDTVSSLISTSDEALQTAQPNVESKIRDVEKDLGELQGIDRTIAELRQAVDNTKSDIRKIDSRIKDLQEKQQRIKALDSQRITKYAALMQKTAEQRLYLQEVIDRFETDQGGLLTGLSFSAQVDLSLYEEYIDRIADKLDGRTHSYDSVNQALITIVDDVERKLNSLDSGDGNDDGARTFLPVVERLREWADSIRLKQTSKESEFYNALLRPFFRIGLHIEFNGRPLEALSMGERAIVLLKVLLGLDDKPLLIDQPEEHLDNRYIYDELTPAFRSAKARRQIIIATHNANLVVNTDAEQIIVAEHENGMLSYRVGSLEDLTIRDSITTILEGGDQAFKKREEKYGYLF